MIVKVSPSLIIWESKVQKFSCGSDYFKYETYDEIAPVPLGVLPRLAVVLLARGGWPTLIRVISPGGGIHRPLLSIVALHVGFHQLPVGLGDGGVGLWQAGNKDGDLLAAEVGLFLGFLDQFVEVALHALSVWFHEDHGHIAGAGHVAWTQSVTNFGQMICDIIVLEDLMADSVATYLQIFSSKRSPSFTDMFSSCSNVISSAEGRDSSSRIDNQLLGFRLLDSEASLLLCLPWLWALATPIIKTNKPNVFNSFILCSGAIQCELCFRFVGAVLLYENCLDSAKRPGRTLNFVETSAFIKIFTTNWLSIFLCNKFLSAATVRWPRLESPYLSFFSVVIVAFAELQNRRFVCQRGVYAGASLFCQDQLNELVQSMIRKDCK